jgi:tellurite resistance protein TerC
VPAIFGVTKDPFTVFTSNIFAILGLRALYFLLAGVMDLFRYLNYGLSAVLAFVGIKMVGEFLTGHHLVSPAVSLVIILSLLGLSIAASIVAKRREDLAGVSAEPPAESGPPIDAAADPAHCETGSTSIPTVPNREDS